MPDPTLRGYPTGIRWRMNPGDLPYIWTIGSSFPADPTLYDHCFRTDIRGGTEFFWDGTYWLSTQLFSVQMAGTQATYTASNYIGHGPLPLDLDVYLTTWDILAYGNGTGGWSIELVGTRFDNSAYDTIATKTVAFTGDQWWHFSETIGSLQNNDAGNSSTNRTNLRLHVTENSGTLTTIWAAVVHYRLRAT